MQKLKEEKLQGCLQTCGTIRSGMGCGADSKAMRGEIEAVVISCSTYTSRGNYVGCTIYGDGRGRAGGTSCEMCGLWMHHVTAQRGEWCGGETDRVATGYQGPARVTAAKQLVKWARMDSVPRCASDKEERHFSFVLAG